MDRFAACVEVVFGKEGGYSDHREDPGGPTMMGITQATLAAWRGRAVTADDVRKLSREEAEAICRARYWDVLRCDKLPAGVDLMVFDFGVNAGPNRSAKFLQDAVGVQADGVIGDITLAAVRSRRPADVIEALRLARSQYYRTLKNYATFGRGWDARTQAVSQAAQADAAQATPATADDESGLLALTFRPTAPGMESLLGKTQPVLDHGFVRVIDYMGDDAAIVQAARVSYGRGTKTAREDAGLIDYLMRHRHSTPFEMCEVKFHVKLPIFVARQWIRHRTANVNEYSARYSVLDKEFYIPAPEHLAAQASANRQGRGTVLQGEEAEEVLRLLRDDASRNYDHYAAMLNEDNADPARRGLARELARMNLTLNTYTQWYWKTDLHNLFHFLSLRCDQHAQYEIRVYAEAMLRIVEAWVPLAAAAFRERRLGAFTLSAGMLAVVRRLLAGEQVTQETSALGAREWSELAAAIPAIKAAP